MCERACTSGSLWKPDEGNLWRNQIAWSCSYRWLWSTWCGCWAPNSSSLKAQQTPLTTESSPRPLAPRCTFYKELLMLLFHLWSGSCLLRSVFLYVLENRFLPYFKNRISPFTIQFLLVFWEQNFFPVGEDDHCTLCWVLIVSYGKTALLSPSIRYCSWEDRESIYSQQIEHPQ